MIITLDYTKMWTRLINCAFTLIFIIFIIHLEPVASSSRRRRRKREKQGRFINKKMFNTICFMSDFVSLMRLSKLWPRMYKRKYSL